MDEFEKMGDPSLRYDDTERPGWRTDAEKKYDELTQEARLSMIGGVNKYHTLSEMRDAQKDLVPILEKYPDLRTIIEQTMDKRTLEIIRNRLMTVPNQIEFGCLVREVRSFDFYNPAAKQKAVELMAHSNEGISHV